LEVAFESDWAVSTPNALLEMEVAVTRVEPEERGNEPFLPGSVFDPDVGPIGDAIVEVTMVRGRVVYERSR
jgi:hypothetical protein